MMYSVVDIIYPDRDAGVSIPQLSFLLYTNILGSETDVHSLSIHPCNMTNGSLIM